MIRIDIIGPPGVGKTKLLTTLVKKSRNRKWVSNYEALLKVIHSSQESVLKKIFLTFLLRSFPLRKRSFTFTRFFNTTQHYNELLSPLMETFRLKFEKTINNSEIDTSIAFNSFHNYLLQIKEICLVQDCCKGKIVLFDESLTQHTNHTIIEKIHIEKCQEAFPHGIIYLTGNLDTIKQRLLQKNIKDNNSQHFNRKVTLDVETMMKNAERKAVLFNEIGIPVLTIDTTQDLKLLCYKVNEWIDNHFL